MIQRLQPRWLLAATLVAVIVGIAAGAALWRLLVGL